MGKTERLRKFLIAVLTAVLVVPPSFSSIITEQLSATAPDVPSRQVPLPAIIPTFLYSAGPVDAVGWEKVTANSPAEEFVRSARDESEDSSPAPPKQESSEEPKTVVGLIVQFKGSARGGSPDSQAEAVEAFQIKARSCSLQAACPKRARQLCCRVLRV
jgi:hypothetical protein